MAEANKTEQPKKSKLKAWLAAGTLTAVAAGVFVTVSPQFKNNDNTPATVTATAEAAVADNVLPATTKDGKLLALTVDIPALSRGQVATDAEFKASLEFYAVAGLAQAVVQYDQAEVAANIGNIQKSLSDFISAQFTVGTDAANQPVKAKEGTHFGAPKITKVADAAGKTVVWKQKSAWLPGF